MSQGWSRLVQWLRAGRRPHFVPMVICWVMRRVVEEGDIVAQWQMYCRHQFTGALMLPPETCGRRRSSPPYVMERRRARRIPRSELAERPGLSTLVPSPWPPLKPLEDCGASVPPPLRHPLVVRPGASAAGMRLANYRAVVRKRVPHSVCNCHSDRQ